MRRTWWIAAVSLGLPLCGTAQAGVYHTRDRRLGPEITAAAARPLPFDLFRDTMTDLMKISIDPPAASPGVDEAQSGPYTRTRYLKERDELMAKVRAGNATVEETVNLGAGLIRLGQPAEAIHVLVPATRRGRDPLGFLVLANLATAYQLSGNYSDAILQLGGALAEWPKEAPGFTPEQLAWYRKVERCQLHWLQQQAREMRESQRLARQPPTHPEVVAVAGVLPGAAFPACVPWTAWSMTCQRGMTYPLLFPIRFVGESGLYEPGMLAAAEQEQLPKDALAIVQQLLLWVPGDSRMLWLLAELLNAQGDVGSAAKIFDECVGSRAMGNAELLKYHRGLVKAHLEDRAAASKDTEPPPRAAGWLPDVRSLLIVGGMAGLIIGLLAYYQVREIRRRMGTRSAQGC